MAISKIDKEFLIIESDEVSVTCGAGNGNSVSVQSFGITVPNGYEIIAGIGKVNRAYNGTSACGSVTLYENGQVVGINFNNSYSGSAFTYRVKGVFILKKI